jgi:hypothetical protein
MEDLAPLEPARGAARLWCAVLGAGFLVFGVLALTGIGSRGTNTAATEVALGCVALLAALVRLTYMQRAAAMVLLGLLLAAVGLRGAGLAADGAGWGIARTIAAIALPAALLFRARYRAYAPARWILGAAIAAALPFAGYTISRLVSLELGLQEAGAMLAIIAVGSSFLGFMGSETTGGGTTTALGVIIGLAVDVVLQALDVPGAERSLTSVADLFASAAAFAGTSAMAALGLFQILAFRFAADARRIDIHAEPKPSKPIRQPSGDWSTKE